MAQLECNVINVENLLAKGWMVTPDQARELARTTYREDVNEGMRFMSDAWYIAEQIAKKANLEENADFDVDAEGEDEDDD